MLWLAVADLVSLLFGASGTVLLALSIGEPTGGRDPEATMVREGREYHIAWVRSYGMWRWGLRLLILAFLIQLPRAMVNLVQAL